MAGNNIDAFDCNLQQRVHRRCKSDSDEDKTAEIDERISHKNWKLSSLIKMQKIWGIVQQRVCQPRVYNIDELKQRFPHVWHGTDQAIDEWYGCLRTCMRTKGGLQAAI